MHDKPVNPACLRNQGPIEAALSSRLRAGAKVLELGSGTGQHAVFIAERRAGPCLAGLGASRSYDWAAAMDYGGGPAEFVTA